MSGDDKVIGPRVCAVESMVAREAVLPEGKYGIVKSIPPGGFKMKLF